VSLPLAYRAGQGQFIRVGRSDTGGCVFGTSTTEYGPGTTVRIAPDDVPGAARDIAAAMHEAAGLPAPVMLAGLAFEDCDQVLSSGFRTYLATGGLVGIEGAGDIHPSAARRPIARIACIADRAEETAADAEVEELAAVLHDTREAGVKGAPGEWDLRDARAALRWMKDKQQRGSTP